MKDKLQKFMQGRYGADALYRTQLLAAVVCSLVAVFLRERTALSSLFSAASMVLIWWAIFRALSRKIEKRYLENLYAWMTMLMPWALCAVISASEK